MIRILLITSILIVAGCNATGHYRGEGPCQGFHKDQQACERAANNKKSISNVKLGQSLKQVQEIMVDPPEQREVTTDSEKWVYRTSYSGYRRTTIIFKDGIVESIR